MRRGGWLEQQSNRRPPTSFEPNVHGSDSQVREGNSGQPAQRKVVGKQRGVELRQRERSKTNGMQK